MLGEIIEEEKLEVSVQYVRSAENLADALTRVPKAWRSDQVTRVSAAAIETDKEIFSLEDIKTPSARQRCMQLLHNRFICTFTLLQ